MQNAEAGPSTAIPQQSTQTAPSVLSAPLKPLPSTHFYSIEYPGYVQPTSVSLALERLGGQSSVDSAFKRTGGKTASVIELNLRPGNPFSHPIPGEVVATNNVLLKVVKRRRKQKDGQPSVGEYTVEAVGVIPKTTRFRSECLAHIRKGVYISMNMDRHGGLSISPGSG